MVLGGDRRTAAPAALETGLPQTGTAASPQWPAETRYRSSACTSPCSGKTATSSQQKTLIVNYKREIFIAPVFYCPNFYERRK
jgi:hypothetical protein